MSAIVVHSKHARRRPSLATRATLCRLLTRAEGDSMHFIRRLKLLMLEPHMLHPLNLEHVALVAPVALMGYGAREPYLTLYI